jgi:N-acyl-D-amino-acid deacylase
VLDLLIRGGLVIDGTGRPARPGDIGVVGGEIVTVGTLEGREAKATLSAEGRVVAPGFIDMHSHSDLSLPVHNRAESSLVQGITTELVGSCGWSLAPLKQETLDSVARGLVKVLVGPKTYERMTLGWHSFGEYLDSLERKGIGVNIAPLVGQSLIRAHVVGREKRPPTRGEMAAMKDLLRACLDEGAFGFSTGRAYLPGGNARTEEIIELAKVAAQYGALYTSHIKSEAAELLEAVAEAITIGRESRVRVEISHHKAVGPENFGRVFETLAMIEKGRADGIDVNADVYPYCFAQVFMLHGSYNLEFEDVEPAVLADSLRDKAGRAALRRKLEESAKERGREFLIGRHYVVIEAPRHPELEGHTLDDGARRAGKDLFDFCADLLLEEDLKVTIAANMSEADVRAILKHPMVMVGTDAFAIDFPLGEDTPIHPRHYGTFPRVLGHYARDEKLLPLEEMVAKATGRAAVKLGLTDRGWVKEGCCADLVVFDPAGINDEATGHRPYAPPTGIDWVIVNGQVAVDHGRRTDALSGRVLRRP